MQRARRGTGTNRLDGSPLHLFFGKMLFPHEVRGQSQDLERMVTILHTVMDLSKAGFTSAEVPKLEVGITWEGHKTPKGGRGSQIKFKNQVHVNYYSYKSKTNSRYL